MPKGERRREERLDRIKNHSASTIYVADLEKEETTATCEKFSCYILPESVVENGQ